MSEEPTPPQPQPKSVVKVARDLREILELHDALLTQAVNQARDHLMPGGLAMVSLGAVSSLRDWERRVELVEREWLATEPRAVVDGWLVRPDDKTRPAMGEDEDPDWEPPLQTLLFWSEDWREQTDSMYPEWLPTVKTEAEFLRWALDWAWQNEVHFEDFAKDVNAVRRRLENVLHAGDRADRTRVLCDRDYCKPEDADPDWKPPQLIRVYHERVLTGYACRVCGAHVDDTEREHCPTCWTVLPAAELWFSDESKDRWKCPKCKHRYTDDEYKRAHATQLRDEQAEKFVRLADAIGTLVSQGRSERTIRKWLGPPIKYVEDRCTNRECKTPAGKRRTWSPGEHEECPACGAALRPIKRGSPEAVVVGYCDLATHRTLVWWPDLWRLHLTTKTRPRISA